MRLGIFCGLVAASFVLASPPASANGSRAQSRRACLALNDVAPSAEEQALRDSEFPEHQVLLFEAASMFWFGGGFDHSMTGDPYATFAMGGGVHARVDIPLLTPLWLMGKTDLFFGPFTAMFDALVGLSIHDYGYDYTSGWEIARARAEMFGAAFVGRGVCTLERDDWIVSAGAKTIFFSSEPRSNVFALQLGFGHHAAHVNARNHWDIHALYSPKDRHFGLQGSLASSIVAEWLHMGVEGGFLFGGGGWMTMTLGGQLQL